MKISKLPQSPFALALSGGMDSAVLGTFLLNGSHRFKFSVIHFNHGTDYGKVAEKFVTTWCSKYNINMDCYVYKHGENTEVAWSLWRNSIMQKHPIPVLTAHHMDDSVESYLMGFRQINGSNGNIHRPLIKVSKQEIRDYASSHNVKYVDDPSNATSCCRRNKIRNELIPLMKECGINPHNLIDVIKQK